MLRAGKQLELAQVHKMQIEGKGVGIAVFDTGLSAQHPDFSDKEKIVAFEDFVKQRVGCYDDNGHGTHVAGIAAGTGIASAGLYKGVAPKSRLIVLKVLDHQGNGNVETVLRGVDWVLKNRMKYGIQVVNISVGTGKDEDIGEESELVQGVEAMWNAGLVVCVAAGNNGPTPGSIGAPGNSRKVITVGACDDGEEVILNGRSMKNYSGRGPTKRCIKKPDLVAPGSKIISCNAAFSKKKGFYVGNTAYYIEKSGTSMATPMVAGAVALLLGEYPEMGNREVKIRLKNRAVDLGLPHEIQGWGQLNIKKLLC